MKNSGGKIYRENPSLKASKTIQINEQYSPTFNHHPPVEIVSSTVNSNIHGDPSEQNTKFTFKQIKLKAKSAIIDYLKNKVKGTSFTQNTFNNLSEVEKAPNLTNFFELFFNLIRDAVSENPPETTREPAREPAREPIRESVRESMISPVSAVSNRDLVFPLKSKQCKKIRLLKEEQPDKKKKKKSFRHLNVVEKTNDQIKTQLFAVRNENNRLQRLIAGMVEQFKDRKNFYLAQIRKLTQIISVSAKDVRSFIMHQTKQSQKLTEKQDRKGQQISAARLQTHHTSVPQLQRNQTGVSHKTSNQNVYQKQNTNLSNPRTGNISNRFLNNITSIHHFDDYKNEVYLN